MKFGNILKFRKPGRLFVCLLLFAAVTAGFAGLHAQGTRSTVRNSQLWTLWRKGFEDFENAELKMVSGKYPDAIALYTNALTSFREVQKLNPKWNKDVIEYRISRAERRIDYAREKMQKTLPVPVIAAQTAAEKGQRSQAAAYSRKLNAENTVLRRQLEETKRSLTETQVQAASGKAAAAQVRGLLSERDKLEKEISLLKLKYNNLEKLRIAKTQEYDKLLLEEKARSSSLSKMVNEQNRTLIALRKQLRGVIYDKNTLDSRIKQAQKAVEEERTLAAAELKRARADYEALQKKLDKASEQSLAVEKDLAQAKLAAEQLRTRIRDLSTSGNASSLAAKQSEEENAALRKKLSSLNIELELLKKGKSADTEKIGMLEGESVKLRKELAKNIEQRNAYGNMNDSFVKQVAELEKKIRSLTAEKTRLTAKMTTLSAERNAFAARINAGFPEAKRLEELKKQNRELTASELALKQQITRLQTHITAAEKGRDSANANIRNLESRLASATAEKNAAEKKIIAVTAEKAAADKRIAILASANASTLEKMSVLTAEKTAADKKLAAISAEKTAAEKQISSLISEKLAAEKKIAALQAAKSAADSRNAALAADKTSVNKKLNELIAKNQEYEQKILALTAKGSSAEKQLSDQRSSQKKLMDSAHAAYEKEIAKAVQSQLSAESKLVLAEGAKKILEQKLAAAEKNSRELAAEKAALDAKIRVLSSENEKLPGLTAQIKRLSAEKEVAEKALAILKSDVKDKDNVSREKAALTLKLAATEKELIEVRAAAEKRSAELMKQMKKLSAAEKTLGTLNVKSDRLAQAEEQIALLKKEAQKLQNAEKRIVELEKKNSQLLAAEQKLSRAENSRKDLEEAQKKILALQAETRKLQADMLIEKQLKEKLAAYEKEIELLKKGSAGKTDPSVIAAAEAKIRSLEDSMNTLSAEKKVLSSENVKLAGTKAALEKQIAILEKANSRTADSQKEFAQLTAKYTESENIRKSLEAERDKLTERVKKFNKDTVELMREMEKLVLARNQAVNERKLLALELARLKKEGKSTNEKLMASEQRYTRLQTTYDQTKRQHSATMKETIARQNAAIATLRKINSDYLVAIGNANVARDRAEKENALLKAELNKSAKKILEGLRYQEDSRKLAAAEEALKKSKVTTDTLLGQIRLLRKNLEGVGKDNLELRERGDQLGREYRKLAAERNALRKVEAEHADMKKQITSQTVQMGKLQKELKNAALEQQRLETAYKQAKKKLDEWQNQEDPLITRLKKLLDSPNGKKAVTDTKLRDNIIDELVNEIQSERKKQRKTAALATNSHNEALRQKARADLADADSQRAMLDALRVRSQLAILHKDIEDGLIGAPSAKAYAEAEKAGNKAVAEAVAKKNIKEYQPAKSLSLSNLAQQPAKEDGKKIRPDIVVAAKAKTVSASSPIPAVSSSAASAASANRKLYEQSMKDGAEAEKSGDLSMALWHYWQAADAGGKRPEPYIALTKLNLRRGEKDAAEKAYQKALQLGAVRDETLEVKLK